MSTNLFGDYLDEMEARPDGQISGVPSGFPQLDHFTGGWQDSDLIVVGGRPTMGKTSFLLSAAETAALHPERPTSVAIFSLELGGGTLVQRLVASRARVNSQKVRNGEADEAEWERMIKVADRLDNAPIYFDDTPAIGIEKLSDECRRLDDEEGLGLVVIDYLQLLTVSNSSLSSDATSERKLGHITATLKALAKELDVPVILASQLNRKVENRGGAKRPQLTDLRGSGSIEEHADLVAFLYRAERYGITLDEKGDSTEGIAEIIVAKHRNGPHGTVEVRFEKEYARFEPLAGQRGSSEEVKGSTPAPSPPPPGSQADGDFEDDAPF